METVINYCIENPFLIEGILENVSYPDLCDRVYDLTGGQGLDVWLEEEATPTNFLQLQNLTNIIRSIMDRKARSQDNILYFPNRMVA